MGRRKRTRNYKRKEAYVPKGDRPIVTDRSIHHPAVMRMLFPQLPSYAMERHQVFGPMFKQVRRPLVLKTGRSTPKSPSQLP